MAELERMEARLADLATAVEWPATPDLRHPVRARIARARRRRLALLLAAAAVLLALAGGAAAAVSLELRGAVIQRLPSVPSPSPARAGGSAGARLELGDRVPSVAAAGAAARFHVLVPASLGEPDEVWYRADGGVVTLLYRPRPGLAATGDPDVGLLVMEARASSPPGFGKLAGPGTSIVPVTVNGGRGFWISGAPHGFIAYSGPGGESDGRFDSFRLAGDVLIWNQGSLIVRIESGLSQRDALGAAGTVR